MKAVADKFAGRGKNNNGILNEIFLSTIFIGKGYYVENREIPISKLKM